MVRRFISCREMSETRKVSHFIPLFASRTGIIRYVLWRSVAMANQLHHNVGHVHLLRYEVSWNPSIPITVLVIQFPLLYWLSNSNYYTSHPTPIIELVIQFPSLNWSSNFHYCTGHPIPIIVLVIQLPSLNWSSNSHHWTGHPIPIIVLVIQLPSLNWSSNSHYCTGHLMFSI
jgi:hypothetical protein